MDGMSRDWISTAHANRLLAIGICNRTFREKFIEVIAWKRTPGGHLRWSRIEVEVIAGMAEEPRKAG